MDRAALRSRLTLARTVPLRTGLGALRPGPAAAIVAGTAAAVFWVAYDGGSWSVAARTTLAVACLWAVLSATAAGVWPAGRVAASALAALALLTGFGLLSLASLLWSPDAEGAYTEFARVVLYAGVLAAAATGVSRRRATAVANGLALGIAAVAALALASRFFPGRVSPGVLGTLLPATQTRLSHPVGYWNGLAVLAGLGVPVSLRAAVEGGRIARVVGLMPLPALATVIYLAASGAGAAAAAIGAVAFVALATRRTAATAALALATAGSLIAVLYVSRSGGLVHPPLGHGPAGGAGLGAALVLALVCLATGGAYAASWLLLRRVRLRPLAGWLLAAAAVAAAVVAALAAGPADRLDDFRAAPAPAATADPAQTALLESDGGGRWQLWAAAIDSFEDDFVAGNGAGSFARWWLAHGSVDATVQDAHSLYLETLGELGFPGLLLIGGFVLVGLVAGARRALDFRAREGVAAAGVAVFAAWAVAAGVDWMWELTAVTAVALLGLGLAIGTATFADPPTGESGTLDPRAIRAGPLRTRRGAHSMARLGVAVLCAAGIVAVALPYLASRQLGRSEAAVRAGQTDTALSAALAARDLEPWAATPYLQLALVSEQARDLRPARTWIAQAIRRNREDWRLWLVKARIDTKLGRTVDARRALGRAVELAPRSPLLAATTDGR